MTTAAPSRFTAPRPTRGPAPSHSLPDTRYAPGIGTARFLGWFGIGLGLVEVLAPRSFARAIGLKQPTALIQAFGLREIVSGLGILASSRPAGWMWARAGGDALDLAALGADLARVTPAERQRVLTAIAAVLGVTLMDAVVAAQLSAAAAAEG
jgi:hypothetical protein